MNNQSKFHLSIPCKDVLATRKFYENTLGLKIGRNTYSWFDLNLYGHQITFTYDENAKMTTRSYSFDEITIPTFHFGIIVDREHWNELVRKFENEEFFAIGATNFLEAKKGHHKSFFIRDPNGYFIEFKSFENDKEVFEAGETIFKETTN